jgi:hypothetical protein
MGSPSALEFCAVELWPPQGVIDTKASKMNVIPDEVFIAVSP